MSENEFQHSVILHLSHRETRFRKHRVNNEIEKFERVDVFNADKSRIRAPFNINISTKISCPSMTHSNLY